MALRVERAEEYNNMCDLPGTMGVRRVAGTPFVVLRDNRGNKRKGVPRQ